MKIGPVAIWAVGYSLNRGYKKRAKTWPDMSAYSPLTDIDVIGDGNHFHRIDVYHAPKAIRKNRVFVYVHGGAYLFGDRKSGIDYTITLLEHGYDVACLDYEPNDGVRGCLDQAKTITAQIRYLMDHAQELDIDTDSMVLVGDSAGGHFALLMAELSLDPELRERAGLDLGGASFHGVAVHCPVYNLIRATHSPLMSKRGSKVMFGPRFADDEYHATLCPKTNFGSLNMPLFVSSCAKDFLKQESLDLKADCEQAGKDIGFVFISSEKRGVGHVHNVVAPSLSESVEVNEKLIAFADRLF
ncbi:MAG: alpha/beta hydrolase [Erysipelotrichaceae bacterium]|nr:alpha/beta hydrolase [Erysipelotrichaceae bacterium]